MRLPQAMNLGQIAALIGGKVHGDSSVQVETVSPSPLSAKEEDLAFVFEAKLVKKLNQCKACAIVAPVGTELEYPDRNLVLVERPNLAIQKVLTALAPKRFYPEAGIHPTAVMILLLKLQMVWPSAHMWLSDPRARSVAAQK